MPQPIRYGPPNWQVKLNCFEMHIRAELKTCQLRDPFPRSMQKVYPFWASVYPLWDISGHSFTYADLYKLIWTYKTDTGVCGPWLNIIITNTAQYNRPNTHTHISTHHVCVQGASHVVLVGDHTHTHTHTSTRTVCVRAGCPSRSPRGWPHTYTHTHTSTRTVCVRAGCPSRSPRGWTHTHTHQRALCVCAGCLSRSPRGWPLPTPAGRQKQTGTKRWAGSVSVWAAHGAWSAGRTVTGAHDMLALV